MEIKRIISLVLAFCITVGSIQGYALELDNVCPEEVGGYGHDICAFVTGKALLAKGNDYVGIKNVGKDADQSLYFFSYRALDKIVDKFKIYSKEEIKKIFPCDPFPWEVKNNKKSNGILKSLKIGCAAALGGITEAVACLLLAVTFDPNNSSKAPKEKSCGNKSFSFKDELKRVYRLLKERVIYKVVTAVGALFGAVTLGSLYSNMLEHANDQYSESSYKNFLEQVKLRHRTRLYISALNLLKHKIPADFDFRKSGNDFILLQFCESDLYPKGDAAFNKAGIKYSDEEKASFGQRFEELRKNLTEVLKNKEEYGVDW